MTTHDDTILNPEQNGAQAAVLQAESQTNKQPLGRWQTVTIGGVAGIAMGVAASQAIDAIAAESTETAETAETSETSEAANASDDSTATAATTATEVHQANVAQGISFGDAFAAARAEVGPGGVFLWHGQLYNTYTAEEWNAMSDAQKDEFATGVQPLLGQQTATPQHVTTHTPRDGGDTQQVTITEDETPEVHYLGVTSQNIHGQTVNIGVMTDNDVNVALIDVDDDHVFDIRWADPNHNHEMDEGEVTDISDQGRTVEDFQLLSELEQAGGTSLPLEQANNPQEDLAPEMPDYMNDADVNLA